MKFKAYIKHAGGITESKTTREKPPYKISFNFKHKNGHLWRIQELENSHSYIHENVLAPMWYMHEYYSPPVFLCCGFLL